MKKTQGFITVATGSEEYYRLACSCCTLIITFLNEPLPFAILTDQENAWTMQFDNVILMPDGATNTYLDKLSMGQVLPYDINIFIDADCLAFGDLNRLFEYLKRRMIFRVLDGYCRLMIKQAGLNTKILENYRAGFLMLSDYTEESII